MANTRKATGLPKQTGPLNLDTLIAEADKEPYKFTLADKERELPHIETMTYEQLLTAEENFIGLLSEITDEDTAKAIRALPVFALEALFEAWMQHSGVEPGELLASLRS